MPHNLTQTVISEHLADGTMTVGDEIALRIDLPPLQDVLYADFDTSVNRIVAQPFLLNAEVDRVTATRVEGMRSVKSRSLVRSYSSSSPIDVFIAVVICVSLSPSSISSSLALITSRSRPCRYFGSMSSCATK